MKKLRGYIFSREFMGERIPQSIQNLTIREYCSKKKIQFILSSTEYSMSNSNLILIKSVNDLNNVDGIAAYSLFQLPSEKLIRRTIYKSILSKKKELHFALENLTINSESSIAEVENIWNIKNCLPHCFLGKV